VPLLPPLPKMAPAVVTTIDLSTPYTVIDNEPAAEQKQEQEQKPATIAEDEPKSFSAIPLMQVRIASGFGQELIDTIRILSDKVESWCGRQDDLCDDAKASLKRATELAISRLQRFGETLG
jgi:hypothetical protein